MTLLAGASRVDITPSPGVELMGYGARNGRATRVHDPLHARALCLRSHFHGDTAQESVILVTSDLCLITPEQASAARARISARTGVPPQGILIACTHTHSGPETGLGAQLAGRTDPPWVAALFAGIEDAAAGAHGALAPARLRWSRTQAAIGRNRRIPDGPVDREVLVLRVDDASGAPLAVLFQHACHGTVLGHDNLEISADWPGFAAARIERETGATALFVLGAHADIDPRTRGLMDLAISGQSVGLGFDAVAVLGGEVAQAVLAEIGRGSNGEGPVRLRAASRSVPLPIHPGAVGEERAQRDLERRRGEVAALLDLSLESFPRTSELFPLAYARAAGLSPDRARELIARVRLYVRDRSGPRLTGGRREVPVEVQLVEIDDVALLALPLEPTTEVGLDWKARVPGGAVVGIANGWLRYLPHPRDLAEPLAHQRYEVLSSLLAPGACERLLATGEALLQER
jgi:hypothetical protein